MRLELHSRKIGKKFTFTAQDAGGYVLLKIGSSDHRQICHGGGFIGPTIIARSEQSFERQCRNWYRKFISTQSEK